MALEVYADSAYYTDTYVGTVFEDGDALVKALDLASRHIDSLTFNRIVAIGFDNLTDFQQDIIKRVVCGLADFEEENSDALTSALSGYSINGVSQQYSQGWTIKVINGVPISGALYSLLEQTGLTCRMI